MPYTCPSHPDRPSAVLITNLADGDTLAPCGECAEEFYVSMAALALGKDPQELVDVANGLAVITPAVAPPKARKRAPATASPDDSPNQKRRPSGPTSPALSDEDEAPESPASDELPESAPPTTDQ